MRPATVLALLLLLATAPTVAQDADPNDVDTINSILAAFFEVVSGPENTPRNWDRFQSLFAPDARQVAIGRDSTGAVTHQVWSPGEYEEDLRPYFDVNAFFEIELSREEERYGNLAHAFSTYESYRIATHDEVIGRGINSFQLVRRDNRWWILTIVWQPEWPDLPLPDKYLPRTEDN